MRLENEFVFWRAHRILLKLPNYKNLNNSKNETLFFTKKLLKQENEVTIGIYENMIGMIDDCLIITNFGLHLFMLESFEFIAFNQMKSIIDYEDKESEFIRILLFNDQIVVIPVRGGIGKFRDKFEFTRFLDRVIFDIHH